jgi:hypothetical protein
MSFESPRAPERYNGNARRVGSLFASIIGNLTDVKTAKRRRKRNQSITCVGPIHSIVSGYPVQENCNGSDQVGGLPYVCITNSHIFVRNAAVIPFAKNIRYKRPSVAAVPSAIIRYKKPSA